MLKKKPNSKTSGASKKVSTKVGKPAKKSGAETVAVPRKSTKLVKSTKVGGVLNKKSKLKPASLPSVNVQQTPFGTLVPSQIKLTATHCENPSIYLPKYQTEGSACADLVACIPPNIVDHVNIGSQYRLGFRSMEVIDCGFSVKIPDGFKLCISMRSGLAKQGIFILNSPGIVDSDYTGSVKVLVANFSHAIIVIKDGDRFAQCWLEPVYKADWSIVDTLPETNRATGGFGSTGR